jgi:hypothetical protein
VHAPLVPDLGNHVAPPRCARYTATLSPCTRSARHCARRVLQHVQECAAAPVCHRVPLQVTLCLGRVVQRGYPDLVPRDHPLPPQPALATACSDGGGTCESGCAACSCGSGCATLERSRQRGAGYRVVRTFWCFDIFPIIFIYFKF